MKNIFTEIYNGNHWGCPESKSGFGSSVEYTESLRFQLGHLLKCFNINSIFDAPCGDFNWMKVFMEANPLVEYIGGDIVKEIVDLNASNNTIKNVKFIEIDITKSALPKADLMICRDCLFHFSVDSTFAFIKNFLRSEISFLLTSTHVNINKEIVNSPILDGSFGLIDLMSHPYNFPKDFIYSIEDWIQGFPKRRMLLWNREQFEQILK
jgi:hypothetical protein